MTPESRKDISVGEIVNLMSVDAARFIEIAPTFHILWSAPIQVQNFCYNKLTVGTTCKLC